MRGESVRWCDRLVRGLQGHDFEVYALSRSERQESAGWCQLPPHVGKVRTAPLWGPHRPGPSTAGFDSRRERQRFASCFGSLARAVCAADPDEGGRHHDRQAALADRFSTGLYGLAELARESGGLAVALRSEEALRTLESACRAPGALRAAHSATVPDLLAVADRLERALRPLSADWYGLGPGARCRGLHGERARECARLCDGGPGGCDGDRGLAAADLCHAVGAGLAALPGLLAKRRFGTPLLITEYGVRLREHYLASAADAVAPAAAGAPVRALLASFQRLLTGEAYAQAHLITPGNTHARRWQERCGAQREQLRTVYPGMDAAPFAELGERAGGTGPAPGERRAATARTHAPTLAWVGRIEPAKDLIGLLHAFADVRRKVPGARLRIIATGPARNPDGSDYEAACWALAAQLFPDEAADARTPGECPVSFEEVGGPGLPETADAYAAGDVVVLSSAVEGFPHSLVEAMFCGRATVSTDVGAVCEVIGGTGLIVPPRNPGALADSCAALLRAPERRSRLGAAARSRALELFTVEQNTAAFRGIYLELMSRSPVVREEDGAHRSDEREPRPFARPAESHVPGRWARADRGAPAAATGGRRPGGRLPQWFPGVRPQSPASGSGSLPPAGTAPAEKRGSRPQAPPVVVGRPAEPGEEDAK